MILPASRHRRRAAAPLALALLLAGCGGTSHVASVSSEAPARVASAPAGWAGRANVGRAIDLLDAGKAGEARQALTAVLAHQPGDRLATDLLHQIDGDPVALLGRPSFGYVVKPGDTLSTLAGRFLGNPTRFYALGRYNGLSFPATLHAGQAIRIPGTAKPAVAAREPAAPTKAVAVKQPTPAPPAPVAAVVAQVPRPNPGRAAALRAAALEQLNRGAINRAIVLLRQADQLSPGNPLVLRDLDRALRIQRAVQSRG